MSQEVAHEELVVVRSKHIGRWIAVVIIAAIAAVMTTSVFTNPRFGWDVVGTFFRDVAIFRGLGITLYLTVVSMVIGIVLGIIVAVMRVSANPIISGVASLYQLFFRGTPVLVQLLFWYNLAALYPTISFGIPGVDIDANHLITPMMAAILGLGLNESAYMSEIVRAGILSVERGQSDAASALGMSRFQTMRRVILPQAMRVIIPPTGNEVIGMLKATSLVSVLAVPEVLYSAQIISSKNLQIIPLLIVASLWYIIITTILGIGQSFLERRFSRGSSQQPASSFAEMVKKIFRVHAPAAKGTKK